MPATYADHRAQLKAILSGWDMPEDNAEVTAEVLGVSSGHGRSLGLAFRRLTSTIRKPAASGGDGLPALQE